MKTVKQNIAAIFLMIILTACASPSNYYIRNLSNNKVAITLLPILSSNILNAPKVEFWYTEKVIKPRFNSYKKFDKRMIVRPNESNFTFTIPAKSTFYITFSSGRSIAFFDKAVININSTIDTLDFVYGYRYSSNNENIKRFSSGRAIWYDIK